METKVKRREWVKTFAIIFLSVLLVLTFFSNTIMNRSLPEVAAQYTQSGSINARIRGTGTVSANEVYEVSLSQTRKVRSVLVKVGQEVTAGDPLFQLESTESDELKAAQEQLDSMELNYQKSLIESSNSTSTEDRNIQKLRDAYNEALAAYLVHSKEDPDALALKLEEAERDLSQMKQKQSELESELSKLKSAQSSQSTELTALETAYQTAVAAYQQAEQDVNAYNLLVSKAGTMGVTPSKLYENYRTYLRITEGYEQLCAHDLTYLRKLLLQNGMSEDLASELQNAYNAVNSIAGVPAEETWGDIQSNLRKAETEQKNALATLQQKQSSIQDYDEQIQQVQYYLDQYADSILQQQGVVTEYQNANAAGTTMKSAKEALEDALFQASLGDSSSLDIQAAKEAIEAQKKVVEELTKDADGQEITAKVSGVISAINVTAGGTAAADSPVVTITVADRGYTVNIAVTNDQARQVRVGDTAEITNYYWGDITATLENIASDPSSQGQGKMLIFRISGDGVEAGTNLTLSIGQRSANYDCLVPNSAIRSDSNGSFVLVVTSKSSPLGNRYVATRADVQVLASDDTTSAVSGLANGDYVITTSTKPLEAGDMVRLPDNG